METDTIFTQIQDSPLPYHSLKFKENSYILIIRVFMSLSVCMHSILELNDCDSQNIRMLLQKKFTNKSLS